MFLCVWLNSEQWANHVIDDINIAIQMSFQSKLGSGMESASLLLLGLGGMIMLSSHQSFVVTVEIQGANHSFNKMALFILRHTVKPAVLAVIIFDTENH